MLFASAQNRKFRLGSAVCGALTLIAICTSLATQPAHAQTETVLHTFGGCSARLYRDCPAGMAESALTPDGAGNFYGTQGAVYCIGGLGPHFCEFRGGIVYELSPNGSGGWNYSLLYYFNHGLDLGYWDGSQGSPGLVFDTAGNLYGTASYGGANGYGVVWELSPSAGGWTETVLYNFCSQSGCSDGENPYSGVIFDTAGNLYGQTANNVFELSPSAGGWTEQTIAPYGGGNGLTIDASGNIYGYQPGEGVFKLSPNGTGGWNSSTIYTFHGKDLAGTPALDSAGSIYGVTERGGKDGYGSVFKLTYVTKGKKAGTYERTLLHSFAGGTQDGSYPVAGVVLDKAGNIYGTTDEGGLYGDGTVFELVAPSYSTEKLLFSFNGSDGAGPDSGLILDKSGNLYGTTYNGGGGPLDWGVVYEITP